MIRIGVDQIAHVVDGIVVTGREPVDISRLGVTEVGTDSRQKVTHGLFVAIAGERVDGHDYVAAAAANGYEIALVDHEVAEAGLLQIVVDDTVAAMGRLARYNLDARRQVPGDFTVIGITGSAGKTTTKDIAAALLSQVGPTVAPVGSFNNSIGLPLTALKVSEKTRFLIAEMGANHVGEIRSLTQIAPPDIAVVLKVGTAHLGEFGSVEKIFEAKSEIVAALTSRGVAILNADDTNVSRMAQRTQAHVTWFGMGQAEGLASATALTLDDRDRPHFTLSLRGQEAGEVALSLSGVHNVYNALAAAAIATQCGMAPQTIVKTLSSPLSISPHRMDVREVAAAGTHFTLIDDSFNANPDSMRSAIAALMRLTSDGPATPYRVALLGPMLELGAESVDLHSTIGQYAVSAGVDALIAVDPASSTAGEDLPTLAQALVDGAVSSRIVDDFGETSNAVIECFTEPDAAAQRVEELASMHPGTVVLLKGSHASGIGTLAQRWPGEPDGEGK